MPNPRYLTKSRFKLAAECPTKLFYTGKDKFADQSMDNSFLAALADAITVVRGPKPLAVLKELGITPTHRVPEPNTWRDLLTTLVGKEGLTFEPQTGRVPMTSADQQSLVAPHPLAMEQG